MKQSARHRRLWMSRHRRPASHGGDVPRGRNEPVRIVEHFGLRAGHAGTPDMIERVELERAKWTAIADRCAVSSTSASKEKDIAPGRWSVGENKVERLLGKELCVLAWAVEDAPQDLVAVAVTNWSGLKPEERWWLFTMTAAATGGVDDGDIGWRKALRFALTENPVQTGVAPAPHEEGAAAVARAVRCSEGEHGVTWLTWSALSPGRWRSRSKPEHCSSRSGLLSDLVPIQGTKSAPGRH